MRCKACDKNLSDRESTRKGLFTGEFLDLCDKCFDTIRDDVEVVDNPYNISSESFEGDETTVTRDENDENCY